MSCTKCISVATIRDGKVLYCAKHYISDVMVPSKPQTYRDQIEAAK